MSTSLLWWLLALGLGGVELLTGTFFLLVLALGSAGAAVAAWAGATLTTQLLVAALISIAGWALLWMRRRRLDATRGEQTLDAGATVKVSEWRNARTTMVRYRGAAWQAELADDVESSESNDPLPPGDYKIVRVDGTRLIIRPQ